jgi:UDP-N-acetylglucosamine 4,6-dehydratase
MPMLNDANILITGGTGSFGKKCASVILKRYRPRRLIIFSRDELKQYEMGQIFNERDYPCVRYFIGDIRDSERLRRAFMGVDYVIHAAAMKQVPAAEYNPYEAVKTNIIGAQNIVDTAIDMGVKKVLALSTDKAANPINLYGATKLCADKLFIGGNAYAGGAGPRFSVVRYGNVLGSRGSVVPFFLKTRASGKLRVTHPDMSRFWITMEAAVEFVLHSLDDMVGGEIFVPKIPSMRVVDMARAIGPDCEIEYVGIRPGEKIHEVMIPLYEARNTFDYDDHYVIMPAFRFFRQAEGKAHCCGRPVAEDFEYRSDTNDRWLTGEDLLGLLEGLS